MKNFRFVTPVVTALSVVVVTLLPLADGATPQGHSQPQPHKPNPQKQFRMNPGMVMGLNKQQAPLDSGMVMGLNKQQAPLDSGMVMDLNQYQTHLDSGMVMDLNQPQERLFHLKKSPGVEATRPSRPAKRLPLKR